MRTLNSILYGFGRLGGQHEGCFLHLLFGSRPPPRVRKKQDLRYDAGRSIEREIENRAQQNSVPFLPGQNALATLHTAGQFW